MNQGLAKPSDSLGKSVIPKELERSYQILIVHGEFAKKAFVKMRELKAPQIGSLTSLRGIVVRASDVKPQMQVAVYVCDVCGFEVYQVIGQR